jgi:hypothetical protein
MFHAEYIPDFHLGINQRKFNISQTRGMNWRQLLSRNSKFIPNSDLIAEKLAHLGYTPLLFKFIYENVKIKKKEYDLGLH